MHTLLVKSDGGKLPSYAHEGDAGLDLCAARPVDLAPGETAVVPCGIRIAIPEGHVGLVWDRSGLAVKHRLHTFAGVIDSGYRGEIGVVLSNFGSAHFTIEEGMRIAQLLIQPVERVHVQEISELSQTSRGEGRFGSTGK
ncbi:MAG TPA: dUTP diphosphatase [Candidatus Nanoarchaeia archaeon]|nr:dUTP diphosphatase [Candidatus Nanoarchaeia archaeon]